MEDAIRFTEATNHPDIDGRRSELNITLPPTRTQLPDDTPVMLLQADTMAVASTTVSVNDAPADYIVIMLAARNGIEGADQLGLQHLLSPNDARGAAKALIQLADQVEAQGKEG